MKIRFMQKIIDSVRRKKKIEFDNEENRDSWVANQLRNLPSGTTILDAGAGYMRYKNYCSHLVYESQDFCQYDGKGDQKSLHNNSWNTQGIDIVSDITAIPRQDHTYDAILCTEVFEHIPDPISTIKEFSRLLKPDGKLILTAPFNCLAHQTPYFFYTGYSAYWYEKFLKENEFEILELTANGNYFDYILQEVGRLKNCQAKYVKNKMISYPKKSVEELIEYLNQCSGLGEESSEILCSGYHVLAKRN